jgi:predicted nucleic acid-binding protein
MIFVDTSAIAAISFIKDEFHSKAELWFSDNQKENFVITNLVIMEILNWVRYRLGKKRSIEIGERLYSGNGIEIIKITSEDEKNAWNLFKKFNGRGISMVDCTSFVVMKRLKIKKAFAFDSDFKKAGFAVLPG